MTATNELSTAPGMKSGVKAKNRTTDLFTATVYQILRAAKAEGATAKVVSASFLRALKTVYGPNSLARAACSKTVLALHGAGDSQNQGRLERSRSCGQRTAIAALED